MVSESGGGPPRPAPATGVIRSCAASPLLSPPAAAAGVRVAFVWPALVSQAPRCHDSTPRRPTPHRPPTALRQTLDGRYTRSRVPLRGGGGPPYSGCRLVCGGPPPPLAARGLALWASPAPSQAGWPAARATRPRPPSVGRGMSRRPRLCGSAVLGRSDNGNPEIRDPPRPTDNTPAQLASPDPAQEPLKTQNTKKSEGRGTRRRPRLCGTRNHEQPSEPPPPQSSAAQPERPADSTRPAESPSA